MQAIRRQGKSDLLVLSAETEQWLRHGYQTRMSTEAVRRDLGEILAHGEPENGIGQGEVADQAAQPASEPPASEPAAPASNGHGEVVTVDFGDLGPRPRDGRIASRGPGVAGSAAGIDGRAARSPDRDPAPAAAPRPTASRCSTCPIRATPDGRFARSRGGAITSVGERSAPTGSMFLGRQVDDAITLYYRRILEHGERLSARPGQGRLLGRLEGRRARPSASSSGSRGRTTCGEERAFKLGLDAIELTFKQLVPRLGEPVAVQRRVEYALARRGLEWSVLCFLDLETVRRDAEGNELPIVVDYKVKTSTADPVQGRPRLPALGVPRRALARGRPGRAVSRSPRSQSRAPGAREMSASIVTTSRSTGQLRGALVRIAQVGCADRRLLRALRPGAAVGVRRSHAAGSAAPRYCEAWSSCPGGAGL